MAHYLDLLGHVAVLGMVAGVGIVCCISVVGLLFLIGMVLRNLWLRYDQAGEDWAETERKELGYSRLRMAFHLLHEHGWTTL